MSEWISVKKRLPEVDKVVDILADGQRFTDALYNGSTFYIYELTALGDYFDQVTIDRVSHWMPLPEPPEKEEMQDEHI